MNPTILANTIILITEANTCINSKTNKSRITNKEIALGNIIFERNDGLFFENAIINGEEFRPFFRFENGTFELSPVGNKNKCSIIITNYEPK